MPLRGCPSRRGWLLFFLFCSCLFALGGCHRQLSIEEHRAVAVVKEYNLLLPRAYLTKRADLVAMATANERERLATLITGLEQRGLLLDSRQESFDIGTMTIFEPPLLADVNSTEVWWYRHVDSKSSATAQAPRRLRYQLRYRLVQSQGQWLVAHLELLKSEELPADT